MNRCLRNKLEMLEGGLWQCLYCDKVQQIVTQFFRGEDYVLIHMHANHEHKMIEVKMKAVHGIMLERYCLDKNRITAPPLQAVKYVRLTSAIQAEGSPGSVPPVARVETASTRTSTTLVLGT